MSSDDAPKEIYLQPKCCASPEYGQLWCEDPNPEVCDDGKEWVKYVRHDLDLQRSPANGDTKILRAM